MTVAELISKLQELDQDLIVITPGYERGYNDIEVTIPLDVVLNVHSEWYYGSHDEASNYPDLKSVKAIVIN